MIMAPMARARDPSGNSAEMSAPSAEATSIRHIITDQNSK
jgi:hypothetical protein